MLRTLHKIYSMPARFYELDIYAKLKDRRKLSAFIDALISRHLKHIKKINLNYIFCTDDYLLGINRQFLGHNTLTDIITFDLSEQPGQLLGEIYISIDRVKENAIKFETAYINELHRVIFHGALHLCGYKDKTEEDIQVMRGMEAKCLRKYLKK